jgi:catechol 2,3-dioxygenase-like lactoylglutathione lyase family enzyme
MSTPNNGAPEGDFLETTDENGVVHYFEKVEEVEMDGQPYALLIYQGNSDEEEEAEGKKPSKADKAGDEEDEDGFDEQYVLMRITREEDGDVFEMIEDEDEFKKVMAFLEAMDYEFDLEEDEEESEEGGHVHGPGCSHGHSHAHAPHDNEANLKALLEELPHKESQN